MAEDIRDMSIVGKVYEFKNQTKGDLFILRDGTVLDDQEEMLSVGGYSKVFSLEHNEPVLGLRIIEDKTEQHEGTFYLDNASSRWMRVKGNVAIDAKLAQVIDENFLKTVDDHFDDVTGSYRHESFVLGPNEVMRNGLEGPMLKDVNRGDVVVRRVRKDGKIRFYWPKGSKMFIL